MSSASASSSTLPFPPVSSSSNAPGSLFATSSPSSMPHSPSQTWRLSEPSSSGSGFTIVPTTPEDVPALPKITRAPHTLQRVHTRSRSNRSRQVSANAALSSSDEPRLLENTLKLESLGVSDFTPNPSIAPKVTISAKCRPDPKVIFDQGPFIRSRQSGKSNGYSQSGERTREPSNEVTNGIQSISLSSLAQQVSSTSSTAGTTSLSSPTSSTGPLPNVATPASSFITDADAVMPTSPTLARKAAWSKPRSWADLASRMGPPPFTGSPSVFSENVNGDGSSLHSPDHSLSANTSPQRRHRTVTGDRARSKLTPTNGRGKLLSLASIIAQAETQFSAPLTYPRGMVNTGNMCFANAILQTLVYCAPFYNLFRLLGEVVPHDFHNSTPLMEAAIQFLNEFQIISDDVQRNFATSQPAAVDALRELHAASEPFVPEALYDAMKLTKRFDLMRRGHQEDAEEFLGFFLDTLHEELQITMRKAEARNAHAINGKANGNNGAGAKDAAHGEDDEVSQEKVAEEEEEEEEREVNRPSSPTEGEGWLEVGQKGKTSFTRTTLTAHSPITRIFGGKLRSVLRTPGSKDSVTLEPYQPLQLDIQPPHVTTIEEALENLTRPEIISGVMSSARTLVDATKQVFIETLPPILIVHLKRFYYDDIGGVQKSSKVLGYGPTLEIAESVISPARRAEAQRRYKLFGVVYHHGRFASGGHYTVDVLRQDRSEWLHIDDTTWAVTAAPSARATLPAANGAAASAIPASVGSATAMPSSPKPASATHIPAVGDVGGGSAYLMFYAREDAIESLAPSSVASSAKASKGTRHSDTNAGTGNGLLPPISARKLAEAATAGPGPVVPGAPLGARRAGSQSIGHAEGHMKAATASQPRPQPRR